MFSVFVVIWQVVIFLFSAQNAGASSNISGNLTKTIIGFFVPSLTDEQLTELAVSLSFFVRKSAHFIAFFILGVLMYLAILKISKIKYKMVFSFVFCFFYALSDEIHQYFVPGRACRFFDLMIDSCGSIFGIIIIWLIIKKFKKV